MSIIHHFLMEPLSFILKGLLDQNDGQVKISSFLVLFLNIPFCAFSFIRFLVFYFSKFNTRHIYKFIFSALILILCPYKASLFPHPLILCHFDTAMTIISL